MLSSSLMFAGIATLTLFLFAAVLLLIRQLQAHRKTERELRESESRYRDLSENSSDMIQSVDATGRFVYVNREWSRVLGYTEDEARTMTMMDTIHPSSTEHCQQIFAQLLKGQPVDRLEAVFISKAGKAIEVEGSVNARYEGGRMVSTRGIFRDLTERNREAQALRAAEERYRTIFEESVEGIFRLTVKGRILTANQAAARILGYDSPEEMLHLVNEAHRPLHADARELRRLVRELLRRGRVNEYEHRLLRKDGSTVWIAGSGSVHVDPDGQPEYFEGVMADITERKRAEQALRESEELFRTLAGNAPVATVLTDPRGVCLFVNDRYEKITGRTLVKNESHWLDGVHPDDEAAVADRWRQAMAHRSEFQLEHRYATPDGKTVWAFSRAAPTFDEHGALSGYVATIADVTPRRRAEEERDAFFSASLDMLCIANFEGHFLRVNEAWTRTLGYALEDLLAEPFIHFVHPEDREATIREAEALYAGGYEAVSFENRYRTKDGGYRWLSWNARADQQRRRLYAVARDITDDRLLREELHRKNEELQLQNIQVEKATRMKSEFLANMSHELRTPLNGIIGFAELLRDGRAGPTSEMQSEFLDDILTSSRHLLQLINDILDLSKIEAGKMDFRAEKLDLEEVSIEVCDTVRQLAAEKNIRIDLEIDPAARSVELDGAKLKQVLYNYLSNALKFTEEGGSVVVAATALDTHRIRIEVRDSGIGIAPDKISTLFRQFQQLDEGSSKKYAGTGLGLALTRRIVESQGGTVGVDSTLGQGSTFYAILPKRFPEPLPSRTAVPYEHGEPYVLVIDDDQSTLKLMDAALRDIGCRAECVASAENGLEAIARHTPDVVVLDLLLPGMDGIEFLSWFRQREAHTRVPVLLWTNKELEAAEGERLHALEAQIVLKRNGGIRNLLERIQAQLPVRFVNSTTEAEP